MSGIKLAFGCTLFVSFVWAQSSAGAGVDFLRDVQGVLTARCHSCHFGEGAQAKLQLHTREDMLRGGVSGPAIVPGNSAESLLVLRVKGKKGMRMPPAGAPLKPEEIAAIEKWIDEGAVWREDAAKRDRLAPLAPRQVALPPGEGHPVDRLLARYFERNKVTPPALVSDAQFARRAWYDLWGLPPSPEELEAFVRDNSPRKREALVDRLLAGRRQYAEHWISFWNDLLRNDEGVAYHGERKSITAWLLRALEENLPYDQMVRSLLDPRRPDDPDGFLVGVTWRGVVSASQSPPMQAAQNSAQVFLGMNLKCAACHDSFVNRWKLRDTFGLAAMFSHEKLELVRCDVPLGVTAEARFPLEDLKVTFDDRVESRRAAAARWFTHPENGRFSRTLVNRYWRQLFGRGLVEPVDDMDAEPWEADLLDWLAADFAGHGYDLQHLLRRLMTSRAYQMQAVREKTEQENYVFRGPLPRRITAEQFQDTISVVTGDWRIRVPRNEALAVYTREWRLKSDELSRALGRPIRDQVYTERATAPTTLQALELTNGPLLGARLESAALTLLGKKPAAPENLFDSRLMRAGVQEVDVDITGAKELWLVVEDVDSYDPARVIAGWAEAKLISPRGSVALADLPAKGALERWRFHTEGGEREGLRVQAPSRIVWKLDGKTYTRFRAQAVIDERSRASDISPALRFFVFTAEPAPDRLVRIAEAAPARPPQKEWTSRELIERFYLHLLGRAPTAAESEVARKMLPEGKAVAPTGVEDLLWVLLMSPEFQYIY